MADLMVMVLIYALGEYWVVQLVVDSVVHLVEPTEALMAAQLELNAVASMVASMVVKTVDGMAVLSAV